MSNVSREPGSEKFPRGVLTVLCVTLFALTVGLRLLGLMLRGENQVPVAVGAEAGVMAEHVVAGRGFATPYEGLGGWEHPSPSTHLPPAYVYFLAGLLKLGLSWRWVYFTAVIVNLVAGGFLPVVTLRIGQAAGFPRVVSLLAAIGICFCPEAFRAVGLVWDEAIFATLTAVMVWWMVARLGASAPAARLRDAVWMGLASGLIALLNPAMVLALPFAWMAGMRAKGAMWGRVMVHGALFAAMTFAGSLPWNVRNWFLIHPPAYVFVRGPFWLATWSSMHPIDPVTKQPLHPWNGTELMVKVEDGVARKLTEQEYFDYCKERVVAAFRENPRLLLAHVAQQFDAFWLGIGEARRWYKNVWPFFLAQGVPAIAGILGLFAARRRIAGPVLAVLCGLLIVFPLPYYLADASMRYRHPVDFALYMGGAWGVYLIGKRIRARGPI